MAVLGSIGMAIIYGLKVNLSVAMVGMLNHTALELAARNSSHGGHGGGHTILNASHTVSSVAEVDDCGAGDSGNSSAPEVTYLQLLIYGAILI